ncbi:hypothetical protein [Aeromicrobium sp. Leaf350]|uniref:DUF6881 domain-containing protein n=1 Tax=Aeromicrobium sp. Leaf350 TaxID=2876565 RepID=UPI001E597FE1|nr:hypothetical protein [Aeromicrobium sp. Leaf350]
MTSDAAETTFLRVEWRHENDEYPVLLHSALDAGRLEVRKVDVWADGSAQTSDSVDDQDRQATSLASVATPSLDEINADPQFSGVEISAEEFEQMWARHRG